MVAEDRADPPLEDGTMTSTSFDSLLAPGTLLPLCTGTRSMLPAREFVLTGALPAVVYRNGGLQA